MLEHLWSPTIRRTVAALSALAPLATWACGPPPAWTKDSLPATDDRPLACGAERPHEPGHCAPRCGEYRIAFEELDGDCGRRPTQTTRLASDPVEPPKPCTGSLGSSPNHCSSSFDIHCPVKDESGTSLGSIERGQLDWAPDGNSANGTLELQLLHADGDAKCRSSYQTRVQRL